MSWLRDWWRARGIEGRPAEDEHARAEHGIRRPGGDTLVDIAAAVVVIGGLVLFLAYCPSQIGSPNATRDCISGYSGYAKDIDC